MSKSPIWDPFASLHVLREILFPAEGESSSEDAEQEESDNLLFDESVDYSYYSPDEWFAVDVEDEEEQEQDQDGEDGDDDNDADSQAEGAAEGDSADSEGGGDSEGDGADGDGDAGE